MLKSAQTQIWEVRGTYVRCVVCYTQELLVIFHADALFIGSFVQRNITRPWTSTQCKFRE